MLQTLRVVFCILLSGSALWTFQLQAQSDRQFCDSLKFYLSFDANETDLNNCVKQSNSASCLLKPTLPGFKSCIKIFKYSSTPALKQVFCHLDVFESDSNPHVVYELINESISSCLDSQNMKSDSDESLVIPGKMFNRTTWSLEDDLEVSTSMVQYKEFENLILKAFIYLSVDSASKPAADYVFPILVITPEKQFLQSMTTAISPMPALLDRHYQDLNERFLTFDRTSLSIWKNGPLGNLQSVKLTGFCQSGPYRGGIIAFQDNGELLLAMETNCIEDFATMDVNGDGVYELVLKTYGTATGFRGSELEIHFMDGKKLTASQTFPFWQEFSLNAQLPDAGGSLITVNGELRTALTFAFDQLSGSRNTLILQKELKFEHEESTDQFDSAVHRFLESQFGRGVRTEEKLNITECWLWESTLSHYGQVDCNSDN